MQQPRQPPQYDSLPRGVNMDNPQLYGKASIPNYQMY